MVACQIHSIFWPPSHLGSPLQLRELKSFCHATIIHLNFHLSMKGFCTKITICNRLTKSAQPDPTKPIKKRFWEFFWSLGKKIDFHLFSDFACTLKQSRFPTFCFWFLLCITDCVLSFFLLHIYAFALRKMMLKQTLKGDY